MLYYIQELRKDKHKHKQPEIKKMKKYAVISKIQKGLVISTHSSQQTAAKKAAKNWFELASFEVHPSTKKGDVLEHGRDYGHFTSF